MVWCHCIDCTAVLTELQPGLHRCVLLLLRRFHRKLQTGRLHNPRFPPKWRHPAMSATIWSRCNGTPMVRSPKASALVHFKHA